MIHHCSFYYRYSNVSKGFAETILNAHAAVVAFYVLSGFVLAASLLRDAPTVETTKAFFVRRAFRIYPALWVACLLGTAYLLIYRSTPVPALVSDWWLAAYRDDTISRRGVVFAFLGFGNELPVPIWSITVELIGSLLMPWLAYSVTRKPLLFLASTVALLVLSFTTTHTNLVYLVQFAFGTSIVWWGPKVATLLSSRTTTGAMAIAALLLLVFGRQLGGWRYDTAYHSPAAALVEGLAATALIGAIYVNRAPFAILRGRLVVFLGDISFSLYLLHPTVMGFIAAVFGERLGVPVFTGNGGVASLALAFCTLCVTIPLSALSYHYVELPGIRLGSRYLTRLRGLT